MRPVIVRYHQESEGWWAETPDLPTFSAAGATYEEVRNRVHTALPDLVGSPLDIYDDLTDAGVAVPMTVRTVGPQWGGLELHIVFGNSGTSVTRRPVDVGVSRVVADVPGPNRRLESA